jgi:hypothetical protein
MWLRWQVNLGLFAVLAALHQPLLDLPAQPPKEEKAIVYSSVSRYIFLLQKNPGALGLEPLVGMDRYESSSWAALKRTDDRQIFESNWQ